LSHGVILHLWKITSDPYSNLGPTVLQGGEGGSGAVHWLILTILANPDQAVKAQEEIDRIIGNGRVPTWKDYDDLPYVRAFVKECLRFRPTSTPGIPHMMTEDVVVDGFLYPKEAAIWFNTCRFFLQRRRIGY
jgi:cytochrome P450